MSNSFAVAAIDFGTTFSSWGFSFKHDFQKDPTMVQAKRWIGLESAISLKGKWWTVMIRWLVGSQ